MKRQWLIATGVMVWLAVVSLAPRMVMAQQESMIYEVVYGPSQLAEMEFEVACDEVGTVRATMIARSEGLARRIHPFRVRLDTVARPNTGGTEQAQTLIEEKGNLRRYRSRFDGAPRVATTSVIGGDESQEIFGLPSTGHDLLSWMLHIRQEVSSEGEQTESRRYSLWDGWKLVWLDVIPGEVEELETAAGDVRAQAFRLRRTRLHHDGEEQFEAQSEVEELGTLWVEVSDRALPVSMEFRAPIGRVKIRMSEYRVEECSE